MDATEARRFCARMSALPLLLDCVREIGRAARLERAILLRVELVLEELFTNTVRHGYGGERDQPVWLHALCAPSLLRIIYEDAASPFDPLAYRADLAKPLAQRQAGGVGVRLVCELAGSIAYRRADGRNIVTLTFGGPEPGG